MTVYRPALAADMVTVNSMWSSSLRESRNTMLIAMSRHAAVFKPEIDRILARPSSVTIVAEIESVIVGFICADPSHHDPKESLRGHVYYVDVKQNYRRRRIARGLFAAVGIDPLSRFGYACQTRMSATLRPKTPAAKYAPFFARYDQPKAAG